MAAVSTIELPGETSIIQFADIAADAARIELDGADCGFVWGPDWRLHLRTPIGAGKHTLAITLYPSAYNTFGPHHHLDGDIHAVSPVQFEGTKNFADRPEAPLKTHVSAWHVKPLRLPVGWTT
jgi:hypothetical protein